MSSNPNLVPCPPHLSMAVHACTCPHMPVPLSRTCCTPHIPMPLSKALNPHPCPRSHLCTPAWPFQPCPSELPPSSLLPNFQVFRTSKPRTHQPPTLFPFIVKSHLLFTSDPDTMYILT